MIQTIVTYECPDCGSLDIVKTDTITKVVKNFIAKPVIGMGRYKHKKAIASRGEKK